MWLESVWMDVRYAWRTMRKSPSYAAVAVLSLALGIGTTTAIFCVMDALLLRPLPITDPQRLVQVKPFQSYVFSYNMWKQIRQQQDVFSGMFAYMQTTFDLATQAERQSIPGIYVSGDYFSTLGVSAIRGRTLLPSDDTRGAPQVCVLSYGFWQRQYAKSPSVLGTTLSLNGHQFEVVGITPPSFFGIDVGETFDVIMPLESERIVDAKQSAVNAPSYWWQLPRTGAVIDTDTWSILVGGRLKPGIDVEQASARLRILAPAIFQAGVPPVADEKRAHHVRRAKLDATPIANGISLTREISSEAVKLMMLMAGIVLVITCANLANLLLARSTTRQSEFATRLAHGASRWRLIRQVLTESFVLSAIGSVLGVMLARWGSKLLALVICTSMDVFMGTDGKFLYFPFDARLVGFAAMAGICSTLLFGLASALRAANLAPYLAMKSGSAGLTSRRDTSRRMFTVAQVALSMTLLAGAGLLVRTVKNLMAQDQGFDPKGVLTVQASLAGGDERPEWQTFLARELLAKFRSLPGVVSAARHANTHLFSLDPNVLAQSPGGPENRVTCVFLLTSPDYFQTLHTPLFAGRDFTEEDNVASRAVAILSETAARRFFAGTNPLGLTFRVVDETGKQSAVEVVGVVRDEKELVRASGQPFPIVYRPIAQCSSPCPSFGTYDVRFRGPLSNITASAKDAARSLEPHLALGFSLLSDRVNKGYQRERMMAVLAMVFGLLALVLAAIGIYGVTSYASAQRTREMGVRMALGAQPHNVLRLIVGESLREVLIGIALGVLGAFAAGKLLRDLLFEVTPADPLTFALVAGLLISVAALAAILPAYRVLKADPLLALRAE